MSIIILVALEKTLDFTRVALPLATYEQQFAQTIFRTLSVTSDKYMNDSDVNTKLCTGNCHEK